MKRRDLTGQRFGHLVAKAVGGKGPRGQLKWLCLCDCGNEKEILSSSLVNRTTSSCGCMHYAATTKDHSGKTFNGILVLEKLVEKDSSGKSMYRVQCHCGTPFEVSGNNLVSGNTKSCGCLNFLPRPTHGHTQNGVQTPEYRAWAAMITRCTNPNQDHWERYGGRGIRVCEEWTNSFESFLAYVGTKPGPRYSIDRYPNQDGNYEPGNVRWATDAEQARNKSNNRIITHNGRTASVAEWAEITGIKHMTIICRLHKGWSEERALTEPTRFNSRWHSK